MSSSSAPARPEKGAPASHSFHVLDSGGGSGRRANTGTPYAQSPRGAGALALRSPQVRAITNPVAFPTTGASAARTAMAGRVSNAASMQTPMPPHLVQQLMVLAGWTTGRGPWLYAPMAPPQGSPSLSSRRISEPRGMPSTFAYRQPVATIGHVGGNGTVAVRTSAGSSHRPNTSAGPSRSLQISTTPTAAGAGSSNNVPLAAVGQANAGAVQRLAPVLAMPSTGGGKGKEAAPSPNGRVRKRAPPKGSNDPAAAGSNKKPRQRVSAAKKGPPSVKATVAVDANIVDVVNQPGSNPDAQTNDDLKKAPASLAAPPSNSRSKRKINSAAASPRARPSVAARRNRATGAATPPVAKKHTVLTWLIDTGFLKETTKVFYVPGFGGTEKVLSGKVSKTGIRCSCCDTVVPVPVLEAHAGCNQPGQPWEKLLLMSGKTLVRCMQEAWAQERIRAMHAQQKATASLQQERHKSSQAKRKLAAKQKKQGAPLLDRVVSSSPHVKVAKDCSDDACGACADGGQLLCCDTCPSTFHPDCLTTQVPEGSWSCHFCRCMLCMANDLRDLSTCQLCTRKYHHYCRPLRQSPVYEIGPYCSQTCKKMSSQLSDMRGVMNSTGDGFSWSLLKIQKDEPITSEDMPVVLENNVKLAVALGVLNDCFNPMQDRRTKIDMLHQAVYSLGSEFRRLNYEGFHTMVLEKEGEIISVALLRFHGSKLAEMPFAGTLPAYRKQGMMRRLVKAVEQALASVQVENLVIPSVAALVETWKRSFSFSPMQAELGEEIKKLSLVVVTGTTLLQKHIAVQQQHQRGGSSKMQASAPMMIASSRDEQTARLTDDEVAFLEMTPRGCFTDLVAGAVHGPRLCSNGTFIPAPGSSSSFSAA
ncbi:hypothetical protein GUJ93_ZPchr0001g30985 [Zizania palustris]|uniref:PHD-type domain-containing protein n=1 Tax=Zizania palustris TaxID=103762 RepID=A0A8J5VTB7_ZIZPA|nr:hypothetical protein GUJ93_ZPchr0001g30985 [Zizania palustris]